MSDDDFADTVAALIELLESAQRLHKGAYSTQADVSVLVLVHVIIEQYAHEYGIDLQMRRRRDLHLAPDDA